MFPLEAAARGVFLDSLCYSCCVAAGAGTYDWAGTLDMKPDPFTYWGIRSLVILGRRLQSADVHARSLYTESTAGARSLLEPEAEGNTPVQGRVSVREVNSQSKGVISDPISAQGTQTAIDDEIAAIVPIPPETLYWQQLENKTIGEQIVEVITKPFKPLVQVFSKPDNQRFMVIVAAITAPSGAAVCAASIVGAVLYRKRRRKRDEQKQQHSQQEDITKPEVQQEDELKSSETAAAVAAASGARSRKFRSGKFGKVQTKEPGATPAGLDDSAGGACSPRETPSLAGVGMVTNSHIEFLDPTEAGAFVEYTGQPKKKHAARKQAQGSVPMQTSDDGRVVTLEPADTSLSGSGGRTAPKKGKQQGRFGSITGSIAGMASSMATTVGRFGSVTGSIAGVMSSVAGAIGHAFRSSQAGHAYRLSGPDEASSAVRSSIDLNHQANSQRGPSLPGSAGGFDRRSVAGGRGSLDLNAYPGAQKANVNWASAGVFLNSGGQTKLTPPSSRGQTQFTALDSISPGRLSPAIGNGQGQYSPSTGRATRQLQAPPQSVPAQWTLPTFEAGSQSRNASWATGVAAAWAAEMQAASRGATPPAVPGDPAEPTDEVAFGGSTFLLPSRSRRFDTPR